MSPDQRAMEKQLDEHVRALRTTLESVQVSAPRDTHKDKILLAQASLRNVQKYAQEAIKDE